MFVIFTYIYAYDSDVERSYQQHSEIEKNNSIHTKAQIYNT